MAKRRAIDGLKAQAHARADGELGHALYKRWTPVLTSQDRAQAVTTCRRCGEQVYVDTRPADGLQVAGRAHVYPCQPGANPLRAAPTG